MASGMDILFKRAAYELDCAEFGKSDVSTIDDKYMHDGLIKSPKSLRDMLCFLASIDKDNINSLISIGFLGMGMIVVV
jgi:hypothetical protein